jgi:2-polyprenyl-3-methyl-5-hydroxy-6-metoxy-1,4-benzoquinol methylase
MRYQSKEEAQNHHLEEYRSDGVMKGKGTPMSSDYHRVFFVLNSVPKNSKVLDVGVNTGTIALPLMRAGCRVKGIDLVPELVEKAKKHGVFAEQGEAEDLSRFKDNSFDVVICAEVLEHLYDPIPAVEEAFRVLKPGGRYIVTIPHWASRMATDKLGDYHQQNFTAEKLQTLFYPTFGKKNCEFFYIPYLSRYAQSQGIDPKAPQWTGVIATKEKK